MLFARVCPNRVVILDDAISRCDWSIARWGRTPRGYLLKKTAYLPVLACKLGEGLFKHFFALSGPEEIESTSAITDD